jgi:DNA-binding NarL/FixJ family response regulator
VSLAFRHDPDVVLLDVRMPDSDDGLSALARIKVERPKLPVLMLSTFDNPTYLARAVALGAAGCVPKGATRQQLVDAIRRAAAGQTAWTRDERRRVAGVLNDPGLGADVDVPLTQRESDVLRQLALGLTNKQIAQTLDISCETVKEHVQHILRKVGVSDRTQAAVWAVRRGLV